MAAWGVPFILLSFTTNQTPITKEKHLYITYEDVHKIHLFIYPEVGGLDSRGSHGARGTAVAPWVAAAEKAAAGLVVRQHNLSGRGGEGWRWLVSEVCPVVCSVARRNHCSLLGGTTVTGDRVGKRKRQTKTTGGKYLPLSASEFTQKNHPQTSGTPSSTVMDPSTELWAHPQPQVLNTHLSPLCHQLSFFFFMPGLNFCANQLQ